MIFRTPVSGTMSPHLHLQRNCKWNYDGIKDWMNDIADLSHPRLGNSLRTGIHLLPHRDQSSECCRLSVEIRWCEILFTISKRSKTRRYVTIVQKHMMRGGLENSWPNLSHSKKYAAVIWTIIHTDNNQFCGSSAWEYFVLRNPPLDQYLRTFSRL